jgi:hypothetical protein
MYVYKSNSTYVNNDSDDGDDCYTYVIQEKPTVILTAYWFYMSYYLYFVREQKYYCGIDVKT